LISTLEKLTIELIYRKTGKIKTWQQTENVKTVISTGSYFRKDDQVKKLQKSEN